MDSAAQLVLGALEKAREALEKAKEVVEIAEDVMKVLDFLQVVVLMIPRRGVNANEEHEEETAEKVGLKEFIKDQVVSKLEDVLFIPTSLGRKSLEFEDMGIAKMRELIATVANDKNMKSIDVTFIGLNICCKLATDCLTEVEKTARKVDTNVNCTWVCTPWKIVKQNKLHDHLTKHSTELERLAMLIQSAISVASYAVQLEQMESVFDATTSIKNPKSREFWKRHLGRDVTKVEMSEVQEAFLHHFERELHPQSQYPHDPLMYTSRRIQDLWDRRRDGQLSIYEFNDMRIPDGSEDPIMDTLHTILNDFSDFVKSVKIEVTPLFQSKVPVQGNIMLRMNEPVGVKISWRTPRHWKYFNLTDRIVVLPAALQRSPPENLLDFEKSTLHFWKISELPESILTNSIIETQTNNDCLWTFNTTFNFTQMGEYTFALCLHSEDQEGNADETYFGLLQPFGGVLTSMTVSNETSIFFLNKKTASDGNDTFQVDHTSSERQVNHVLIGQPDTVHIALHIKPSETQFYRRVSLFQYYLSPRDKRIENKELCSYLIEESSGRLLKPDVEDLLKSEAAALEEKHVKVLGTLHFSDDEPLHNLAFPLPLANPEKAKFRIQVCPTVATSRNITATNQPSPSLLYEHSFFAVLPDKWIAPSWIPGGSVEQEEGTNASIVSYSPLDTTELEQADVFTVIGNCTYQPGTMAAVHFTLEILESGLVDQGSEEAVDNAENVLAVGFTSKPFKMSSIPGSHGTAPGVCFLAHDGRILNSEHKTEIWTNHKLTKGWKIRVLGDIPRGACMIMLIDPQGKEHIVSRNNVPAAMLLSNRSWTPFVSLVSPGLKVRVEFSPGDQLLSKYASPSWNPTPHKHFEDIFYTMPFTGPEGLKIKSSGDAKLISSHVGHWVLVLSRLGISMHIKVVPTTEDLVFSHEQEIGGNKLVVEGKKNEKKGLSIKGTFGEFEFMADLSFQAMYTSFYGTLKVKHAGLLLSPQELQKMFPDSASDACSFIHQWTADKCIGFLAKGTDEETGHAPSFYKYPWNALASAKMKMQAAKNTMSSMFSQTTTATFWENNVGKETFATPYATMLKALEQGLQNHQRVMELLRSLPGPVLQAAIAGFDDEVDVYEFDLIVGKGGFPHGLAAWLENLKMKAEDLVKQGNFANSALQSFFNQVLSDSTQAMEAQRSSGPMNLDLLLQLATTYEKRYEMAKVADVYRDLLYTARQEFAAPKLAFVLLKFADSLVKTSQFQEAIDIYQEAQGTIEDPKHKSKCFRGLARCNMLLTENETALDYYHQALEIDQGEGDREGEADSLYGSASCLYYLGKIEEALECYKQGLVIREELEDEKGVSKCLHCIGNCHQDLGQLDEALGFANRSLEIVEKLDDQEGMALSLAGVASRLGALGQFEKAIESQKRVMEMESKMGNKKEVARCLSFIAQWLSKQGQTEEALEHYKQSLGISLEIDDKAAVALCYENMGTCQHGSGKFEDAVESYQKSAEFYSLIENKPKVATVSTSLGNSFSSLKQTQNSLSAYETALKLRIELGDNENSNQCLSNIEICLNANVADSNVEWTADRREVYGMCQSGELVSKVLSSFGKYLVKLDKREAAADSYLLSSQKSANENHVISSLFNAAECFFRIGKWQNAFENFQKVGEMKEKCGKLLGAAACWKFAGESQAELAQFNPAIESYKKSAELYQKQQAISSLSLLVEKIKVCQEKAGLSQAIDIQAPLINDRIVSETDHSVLAPGATLVSPNGRWAFTMTRNASAFLFDQKEDEKVWSAGKSSDHENDDALLVMQEDGNLVIYDGKGARWASNTSGSKKPYTAAVTDNGQFLVTDCNGEMVWSTRPQPGAQPHTVGSELVSGTDCSSCPGFSMLRSPSGRFNFVIQLDMNGVTYDLFNYRKPVWGTGTWQRGEDRNAVLRLQEDGNLVLYNGNGRALWSSDTWKHGVENGPYKATLEDDGDLRVYNKDGTQIWKSSVKADALSDRLISTVVTQNSLSVGQTIVSQNRRFELSMDPSDGALCIFDLKSDRRCLWRVGGGKEEDSGAVAKFEQSGNLVVLNGKGEKTWSSESDHLGPQYGPYFAVMGDDGNIRIMMLSLEHVWKTKVVAPKIAKKITKLVSGTDTSILNCGDDLMSPNGRFLLNLESDLTCVLYDLFDGRNALWRTGSAQESEQAFGTLVIQEDGNLVICTDKKQVRWATYIQRPKESGPFTVEITDDGNLRVADGTGTILFTTYNTVKEIDSMKQGPLQDLSKT